MNTNWRNICKICCAWSCDKEPGQAPTQRICQLSIGPFAYGSGWMGLYLGCHDSGCGLIILSTGRADPRPQHDMPSSSRVLAKAGQRDRKPFWIFNAARAWSPSLGMLGAQLSSAFLQFWLCPEYPCWSFSSNFKCNDWCSVKLYVQFKRCMWKSHLLCSAKITNLWAPCGSQLSDVSGIIKAAG